MNVMLDLETMGSVPGSAIVAIGAVKVDFGTGTLGDTFYCRVDLKSCVEAGLTMDPDTVMWWMQQSDDARKALHDGDRLPLTKALLDFRDYLLPNDPITVGNQRPIIWGNGATFDNVLLSDAYRAVGLVRPWTYRNDMCYRTLKNLNPDVPLPETTGTAHNALDDAAFQAQHLLRIIKAMPLPKVTP